MINLLPLERKKDIRAARINVTLLRYNLIMVGSLLVLVGFCLGFYAFMQNNQQKALATRAENDQKTAALSSTRTEAEKYRGNLTIAKQILKNGISYTDVLISITKLLPDGVILDSVSLNAKNFGQQTEFLAHTVSYSVAEDLKQNFQTSKTFSNVYFKTLGYSGGTDSTSKKYPVNVSMSAKLNAVETFYEN